MVFAEFEKLTGYVPELLRPGSPFNHIMMGPVDAENQQAARIYKIVEMTKEEIIELKANNL